MKDNFDEMFNSFFNDDEFSKMIENFFGGSTPKKTKKIVVLPNGSKISTWTYMNDNKNSKTTTETNIDVLKQELQKSIESENYEKAAQIRDLIKQSEKKDQEIVEKENKLFSDLESAIKSRDLEKAKEIIAKIESMKKVH